MGSLLRYFYRKCKICGHVMPRNNWLARRIAFKNKTQHGPARCKRCIEEWLRD